MAITHPAPILTEDNEAYWLAAKEGRLVGQRCSGCGRFNHPPRPMCPQCHSTVWEMVELDKVTSWGARFELYNVGPMDDPHPAHWRTDIAILLAR